MVELYLAHVKEQVLADVTTPTSMLLMLLGPVYTSDFAGGFPAGMHAIICRLGEDEGGVTAALLLRLAIPPRWQIIAKISLLACARRVPPAPVNTLL